MLFHWLLLTILWSRYFCRPQCPFSMSPGIERLRVLLKIEQLVNDQVGIWTLALLCLQVHCTMLVTVWSGGGRGEDGIDIILQISNLSLHEHQKPFFHFLLGWKNDIRTFGRGRGGESVGVLDSILHLWLPGRAWLYPKWKALISTKPHTTVVTEVGSLLLVLFIPLYSQYSKENNTESQSPRISKLERISEGI